MRWLWFPAPWVCDFDGDGKQDLLVGDGANGKIYLYRNTGTDTNGLPLLAPKVALQAGGADLTVGIRATPYVCDWDGDGLPDLLSGDGNGNIWFFKNTNTVPAPLFAPGVKLQAGGTTLALGIRSVVRVFDWDGDGLKDLVCSSENGVFWCRNTNSNSNPILLAPVPICAPTAATNVLVPLHNGGRNRIDLVDWNNDGVTDLILGNTDGGVYYYEGYKLQVNSITPQPGNKIALQWNSSPNLRYNVLASGYPSNLQDRVVTNLPSGGNSTTWTSDLQDGAQFFRVQISTNSL